MFFFSQVASELWPVTTGDEEVHHGDSYVSPVDVEEDVEKQIAKELATINRPRREQTFGMAHFLLYSDARVDRLIA